MVGEAEYLLLDAATKIDVTSCSSTVPVDKDYILNLIEHDLGYEQFNSKIRKVLKQGLYGYSDLLLQNVYTALNEQAWSGESATIFYNLSDFYRLNCSMHSKCREICTHGLKLQAEAIANVSYKLQEPDIWLFVEHFTNQYEDFDMSCKRTLEAAVGHCQVPSLERTAAHAELWSLKALMCLAESRMTEDASDKQQLLKDAQLHLIRAVELAEKVSEPDEQTFRFLQRALWFLGRAHTLDLMRRMQLGEQLQDSDFRAANEVFESSLNVWKTHFGLPLNYCLCNSWGRLKLLQQDFKAAANLLLEGRRLYKMQFECEDFPADLAEGSAMLAEAHMKLEGHTDLEIELINESLVAWSSLSCKFCQLRAVKAGYETYATLLQSINNTDKTYRPSGAEIMKRREALLCKFCKWKWVKYNP